MTIVELKGGEDYSNISCFFIHKEYYNSTLGGSGGMLPQEIFLTLKPLRLFLVASEHLDGEKPVSGIPPYYIYTMKNIFQSDNFLIIIVRVLTWRA